MGMELDEWKEGSCIARFGTGHNWATLYQIDSLEEGKGHATKLLRKAKRFYESEGLKVGGSVALNERMRGIYKKVDYEEYND